MALPTTEDDFRKFRENGYYYVDKTLFIEEFLQHGAYVSLITRPKGFGKTLNLTMLRDFFDITKDSKDLFKGTKIMKTEYADIMNTKPVIYMSFKTCCGKTHDELVEQFRKVVLKEYIRFNEVLKNSNKLSERHLESFIQFLDLFSEEPIKNNREEEEKRIENLHSMISYAIYELTQTVSEYYDMDVVFLLDDYDVPFIEAKNAGYYKEVIGMLESTLGEIFKGNSYLDKGIMAGVQRMIPEGVCASFNNVYSYTVIDFRFKDKFGFTEKETKDCFNYFKEELTDEIKKYYGGYVIEGEDLYNSTSIITYLREKRLDVFWEDKANSILIKNEIVRIFKKYEFFFYHHIEKFRKLIEGESFVVSARIYMAFSDPYNDSSNMYGMILNAGYITAEEWKEEDRYRVKIPNEEVRARFKELVLYYLK